MSSPGFQADSAAMTRAVQGFEETATSAKSTMASLESELTEALRNYKGDQAVAFWDLQRRLQEKMTAAVKELDTMSQLVHTSHQNYGRGDADVHQSFQGVGNTLEGSGVIPRLNP